MDTFKVRFVNKEIGSVCPSCKLQGMSGKTYGTSHRESGALHVVEMSLENYEKCIEDVSRAYHLPMRRWVPHFVREQVEPQEKPSEESRLRHLRHFSLISEAKQAGVDTALVTSRDEMITAILESKKAQLV